MRWHRRSLISLKILLATFSTSCAVFPAQHSFSSLLLGDINRDYTSISRIMAMEDIRDKAFDNCLARIKNNDTSESLFCRITLEKIKKIASGIGINTDRLHHSHPLFFRILKAYEEEVNRPR